MPLKLPKRRDIVPIVKMITDLDNSDTLKQKRKSRKQKRDSEKKEVHKEHGNVTTRSRSTDERRMGSQKHEVDYLKVLLQTKDDQITKLVQKVSDLHQCNDEFASENSRLQTEVHALRDNLEALDKKLLEQEKQDCKECIELKEDKQSLLDERESLLKCNKNLKDDIEMMKTLVFRLNVQIEQYQERVRLLPNSTVGEDPVKHVGEASAECSSTKVNWGSVNTHTLAPLLNAYQEIIKEKDDLIHQHEREITRFSGDFKEIIRENERLHEEMDQVRQGRDGWNEDKVRLQAQLDICRNKAEVQSKRADLAKEKLVEVLRCYEQKVQSQSLDLERIQEAYSRAKGEIITLRNIQSNPEALVESLKECQKLFEELKSEHDTERTKLSAELTDSKRINSELEDKLTKVRGEITTLNSIIMRQKHTNDVMRRKIVSLKHNVERLKESREGLKSRLETATHWAQKLEASKEKVKHTWENLRDLESIVKRKDSELRSIQEQHEEEVERLERKLRQREETIKSILKDRAKTN